MKMFYKRQHKIVLMVVMALLMQIVGPVVGDYVYASGGEEAFTFEVVPQPDGNATVYWEYKYTTDGEIKDIPLLGYTLANAETGDLVSEKENIKIGEYSISKEGKMTVKFVENIDNTTGNLLKNTEESEGKLTVPLMPLVPATPEEPTGTEVDGGTTGTNPDGGVEGASDPENSTETEADGGTKEATPGVEGETPSDPEADNADEDDTKEPDKDSSKIIESLLGVFSKNIVYAEGESYTFKGSFDIEGVEADGEEGDAGEELVLEVDVNVITKITATKDGEELKDIANYTPKMEEEIDLKFEFTLPEGHDYGAGSILIFPLPNPLKPASGGGDLYDEEKPPVKYAEYKIGGGNVIITFNDNVRFKSQDGTNSEGLKTTGEFSIKAKYEAHEGNTDLDQELKLPGSEDITLTFTPKDGKVIEDKTATQQNSSNKNSQYVDWTVNVNTAMDDLGDGKKFKDVLEGNHKYTSDEFKVTQYVVDTQGNRSGDTDVTENYTGAIDTEENSFTLNLTGKYAYEIKYRTIPGDTENQSQTLNNTASFGGEDSPANTTIQYGAPLAKIVSKTGETANWTITVNANRRTIASGTKITDTWGDNADKHEFVGDITVDGLDSSEYTISDIDEGFKLTLDSNIDKEFTIKYSTKPKDLVTGNIDLINTVVRSDREQDVKGTTAKYNQNVLAKSNSNINYQNKTVDWTITVNSAGYTMPTGTVITDAFVYKNLKIVDGTFKVNEVVITDSSEDYTLKHSDGDVIGDKKGGFTLTTKKEIEEPITIKYTTNYDVQGVENIEYYKNKVGINWDTDYSVSDIESTVVINDQQKSKGYKSGSYNYKNKEFDWFVGINYNLDTVTNPVFTDTLTDTQEVLGYSIEVYKLDLTGGGNGSTVGEPITDYTLDFTEGSNTFTITFNEAITQAYRVVYKSKNKDDYYAPQGSNYIVKNEATLTGDNDYGGKWNGSVTVQHTESLIDKKHNTSKYSGSAKLAWDMKLNWSQSTLSDVKIVDEIGLDTDGNPNQMIYKDSFKITEMNFSGTGSNPSKGAEHLPGTGLYDVAFSEDGLTFTITFNEEIDKAYTIEYETYFLGESGSELKNTAKLSYTTSTNESSNDKGEFSKANFTFSGSASNKKGQLEITKVDKDDENVKLSGAEFELWSAKTGGFLIERVSIDTDGVYKFKTKVGQTDYYLRETKAPEGYSLDASDYKDLTKVNIGEEVQLLQIENTRLKHGVELTKFNNDKTNELPGAEFTLHKQSDDSLVEKDRDGNDLAESFITNSGGKITVGNLPSGTYYFKEISPPDNYLLPTGEDAKTQEFTIRDNQIETLQIGKTNEQGKGKITVTKVDKKDNTLLDDVEFTLTDASGILVKTKKTVNGVIEFNDLPYGKYTLREISAHQNYVIDENPILITLDGNENNINKEVKVTNSKKDRSVKLTKYNANKTQTLKGAIFELRKEEPAGSSIYGLVTVNESLTTDDNGEINLTGLEVGKYQLIETKAPSGYRLDKRPVEFEIKENQTSTIEVEMTNNRTWVPGPDPTNPGGGGGGVPKDPEDPKDPPKKDPDKPVDTEETPDPTDPTETPDPDNPDEPGTEDPTDPNEPGSETPEPDPTKPIVLDPPTKGTITFDEDGNWIYTPNEGEKGTDTFTIVHPDGREETITINLDDIGIGTIEITAETLPRTGAVSNLGFYLAGLSMIFLGIFLRKRKTV